MIWLKVWIIRQTRRNLVREKSMNERKSFFRWFGVSNRSSSSSSSSKYATKKSTATKELEDLMESLSNFKLPSQVGFFTSMNNSSLDMRWINCRERQVHPLVFYHVHLQLQIVHHRRKPLWSLKNIHFVIPVKSPLSDRYTLIFWAKDGHLLFLSRYLSSREVRRYSILRVSVIRCCSLLWLIIGLSLLDFFHLDRHSSWSIVSSWTSSLYGM